MAKKITINDLTVNDLKKVYPTFDIPSLKSMLASLKKDAEKKIEEVKRQEEEVNNSINNKIKEIMKGSLEDFSITNELKSSCSKDGNIITNKHVIELQSDLYKSKKHKINLFVTFVEYKKKNYFLFFSLSNHKFFDLSFMSEDLLDELYNLITSNKFVNKIKDDSVVDGIIENIEDIIDKYNFFNRTD